MAKLSDVAVPLEEALGVAGVGKYTNYVMLVTGLMQFCGVCGTQVMAVILPVAGCQLGLSPFSKGVLTSSAFSGLVFSSLLFGFLADTYGRRKIMVYCGYTNACLSVLASLSPDHITLTIIWFINGFVLGGVFSPAFVFVTEFCPQKTRARSVLVPTCVASLASVYLPAMAWLILPLELNLPMFGGINIETWRLFLALIAVPLLISCTLLYYLPDSPKFTLYSGDHEETVRILTSMYAINNNKPRADFPIAKVCLDSDETARTEKDVEGGNVCIAALRNIHWQFTTLFKPPLLLYTVMSSVMLFGFVGLFNTLYLWFPEQVHILMSQHNRDPMTQLTMCEVMAAPKVPNHEEGCTFDSDIFIISGSASLIQSVVMVLISFVADKIGKKLFIVMVCTASLVSLIVLQFITDYTITVLLFSLTVIILGITFPLGLSIVVGFFPTSLRGSATSVTMIFGRIGASAGSQIYGALIQSHCAQVYWGMSAIVFFSIILNVLVPSKRTP